MNKLLILFISVSIILHSCVKEQGVEEPVSDCEPELEANITISELQELYQGDVLRITEPLFLSAYVISSDKEGNFFGSLHLQDHVSDPSAGLQLEIDLSDSHLWYPPGTRVILNLQGLYLGKSKGAYKLGSVYHSFGNPIIGRLPASVVDEHLLPTCELGVLQPRNAQPHTLHESMFNTFVRFDKMEFADSVLGQTMAEHEMTTIHSLSGCEGEQLKLLNSGYASFRDSLVPPGMGKISGVLVPEGRGYALVVRDMSDIRFTDARCRQESPEPAVSGIMISELADPDNNPGARFIELFNSNLFEVSLDGWSLRRYTNASTEVSSAIDLSGQILPPESTLLISPNPTEFALTFGFDPDMGSPPNGPADSNGDDNLELLNGLGERVDIFGIIGEDGSGTSHEFEDGRAVRKVNIVSGNISFDPVEWEIYNDSGLEGTVNLPQLAPQDFSPGIR